MLKSQNLAGGGDAPRPPRPPRPPLQQFRLSPFSTFSKCHIFSADHCITKFKYFKLLSLNNARPHSAGVSTAWLCRHLVRVLDWPACSPDLSPIENVWCIMKRRIRQRRPQTVQQLKSCIHQEWAKIPLAKLQQLIKDYKI